MFLYDSVNAKTIPAGAQLVAGYVDGAYANVADLKKRFPHAYVVTITVFGKAGARVADVETGDLTPAQGAKWALDELHAGRRPTIYCSAAVVPAVKLELSKLRVDPVAVDFWVAHWVSVGTQPPAKVPAVPTGAVALQYAANIPYGPYRDGAYDLSVTNGHWPFPAPHKAATPQPVA
jgi:hypothetical protein